MIKKIFHHISQRERVVFILRCLLVLLFVYSGIAKLLDIRSFILLVTQLNILPIGLSELYGTLLPFIEIISAIALLHPRTRKFGGILIILMLISFITTMIIKAYQGTWYLSCGCFGVSELSDIKFQDSVLFIIARNIVLLIITYLASIRNPIKISDPI